MFVRAAKSHSRMASSLMLLLVVFTFTLKAVLPAGFMPVINKDGFTEIVICSGMGEKTIKIPSDESPSPDHKDDQAGKICAYQVLASGKTLLSLPAFAIPTPVLSREVVQFIVENKPTTTVTLSFDARGPPSA